MLQPYFENTIQVLTLTVVVVDHDSGEVSVPRPLNLSCLRDVSAAYEVSNRINWYAAVLRFTVIVSSGATAGNLDIKFRPAYIDSGGIETVDTAYCGTALQIPAAQLGLTGSFRKSFSILTEDYGPLSYLYLSYSTGDLHSTVVVYARRWCYV